MSQNILVVGATSAIARALVQRLAAREARLVLAGRSHEELDRIAADVRIRHRADVVAEPFDALDFAMHGGFVSHVLDHFAGQLDGVIVCLGTMVDQQEASRDFESARRMIDTNYTAVVSVLDRLAGHLEQQGSGFVAAISSVAGDRGRQSNYTYGSAKAALTVYLQGLRNRLTAAGVHVLTIKPGFVDTAMTHGLLDPDSPMVAAPDRVARDIDRAVQRRHNQIYTPWFWWAIMRIICCIPESIFKRMKL